MELETEVTRAEHCLFCCQVLRSTDGMSECILENDQTQTIYFPGSSGSLKLNEHLQMYFIISKMLSLPNEICCKVLSSYDTVFLNKICKQCKSLVNKATDLHIQCLSLQQELTKLEKMLHQVIKNSQDTSKEFNFTTQYDWWPIRQLLCQNFEVCSIKVEMNSEESQLSYNSNNESGDDFAQNFVFSDPGINDKIINTQDQTDSPRTSQTQTSKCLLESDSDVDYMPDVDKKAKKSRNVSKSGPKTSSHLKSSRKKNAGGFQCTLCQSYYTSFQGFKKHVIMHDESRLLKNKFDCPTCGHPNLSEEKLRRHIVKRHEKLKNTCMICGHVAHRRWSHEKHMLKHHGIKIWKQISESLGEIEDSGVTTPAKQCLEISPQRQGLKTATTVPETKHEIQQNTSAKIANDENSSVTKVGKKNIDRTSAKFQWKELVRKNRSKSGIHCDLCKSVYTTLAGFRKHVEAHVESDKMGKKYDCFKCGHPNLSEEKLRRHLVKIHATLKNTCSICGHVANRRWLHEQHMQTNHGIKIWNPIPPEQENKTEEMNDKTQETRVQDSIEDDEDVQNATMDVPISKPSNPKTIEIVPVVLPNSETLEKRQRITRKNTSLKIDSDSDDQNEISTKRNNDDDWVAPFDEKNCSDKNELSTHNLSDSDSDYYPGTGAKSRTIPINTTASGYPCDLCPGIVYKSARGYQMHTEEHNASRQLNHKFDCDKCGYPNSSEKRLRYHKGRAHNIITKVSCTICGYQANRPGQLRMHMKKHNNSYKPGRAGRPREFCNYMRADGRFECSKCDALYGSRNALKRHLLDHDSTQADGKKFDCDICSYPCQTESRLQRHKIIKHETKKSLTCQICQKTLVRPYLLKTHLRNHKDYDEAFNVTTGKLHCKQCNSTFEALSHLQKHRVTEHQNELGELESFLCPQCGECFTSKPLLQKHIRTRHENRYKFTCEECGKGFDCKNSINSHRKVHEVERVREFVCEICGVAYSHKKTLYTHKARFHNNEIKPVRSMQGKLRKSEKEGEFRCKWCNLVFPFKYNLVHHIPTAHKDLYTFNCDLCKKSYISQSSLRLHKEISHSKDNIGQFSCTYCGKTFTHNHKVQCHHRYCRVKKGLDPPPSNLINSTSTIN